MYARVPFIVDDDEWISHDNPASILEKVSHNYVYNYQRKLRRYKRGIQNRQIEERQTIQ